MPRPSAATVAYYDAAVPDDPRAKKGQMFGCACSFVNGNMFFGTFHDTVIARLGPARVAALAGARARIFEPMPGRLWKDYLQIDAGALPKPRLAAIATEALDWTDALPPKPGKASPARGATRTAAKPASKKPATKKPATKKPVTKKPASKKPAAKKPAAKKPAAKKPAAKKR